MSEDKGRWRFLALICAATLMSLTTWFSATAVLPVLVERWALGTSAAAWLTNGVQAGFVSGALLSAFLGLGDRWPHGLMMAGAAGLACIANLLLLLEPGIAMAIGARILTGVALAGVYPPAVKLIATWFRTGRGLAMGVMIGALTVGSALPHLVRALGGGFDWRIVVLASSVFALAAALIFAFALKEGPYPFPRAPARLGQIGEILRNRPVMLANCGYFGHMWELYAVWGWFLAYTQAAQAAGNRLAGGNASALTFLVIAIGFAGAAAGGWLADRIGRCHTTALALALSGSCAIAIGFTFDGPAWLFTAVALVWGVSVIADSAQFSAAVTELSEPGWVGSALALQMGVGFAITIGAIWLIPLVAQWAGGWRWVFLVLVPGPVFGAVAMLKLRQLPEATRMAGGLR